MRKQTHVLRVVIEARTKALINDAIEQLARSACDVSNSMDESVHILIEDEYDRREEAHDKHAADLRETFGRNIFGK